jgi:Tn3 transposase DDE domain
MLALHLLQSSLVFINTQLLQAVLRDPAWAGRLTEEDRRGLSPLFWSHVNPTGGSASTWTPAWTSPRHELSVPGLLAKVIFVTSGQGRDGPGRPGRLDGGVRGG